MHLGISSYSFPWAVDAGNKSHSNKNTALKLLRYATKHAVKYVQFGDNLPLHLLSIQDQKKIKQTADQAGIKLEVGTRGLTLKHIQEYISIAAFFQSPFLRVVIDDTGYHPSEREVLRIIKKTLPLLKEKNIILAIENHDRFSSLSLQKIILATDPELVGICLDTANSIGAGEGINEVLNILSPYTINLHIKDISIKRVSHKMGFTVEGTAAGEGMLNIPYIIKKIEQTGRCKTATLEVWSNPLSTASSTIIKEKKLVEKSIHYLKKYLS